MLTGPQLFCIKCARLNAESAIGLARYELKCMSTDDCPGTFSHTQRCLFLDKKLTEALDRIECDTVLRLAALENLEKCPACDFAAEYPPVEENKVFECLNPACQKISCRICRQDAHIPKTCSEAASENGYSARREIEEAMSAALIRTCNKCKLFALAFTVNNQIAHCNRWNSLHQRLWVQQDDLPSERV